LFEVNCLSEKQTTFKVKMFASAGVFYSFLTFNNLLLNLVCNAIW